MVNDENFFPNNSQSSSVDMNGKVVKHFHEVENIKYLSAFANYVPLSQNNARRIMKLKIGPLRIISLLDRKSVSVTFDVNIQHPRKLQYQEYYFRKLCIYFIHLNNEILSKVTSSYGNKKSAIVYSPLEYENIRDKFNKEEDFRDPYEFSTSSPSNVKFSCLLYLTSREEPYDDLDDDVKIILEERRESLLKFFENNINDQLIKNRIGRFFCQELEMERDVEKTFHNLSNNHVRVFCNVQKV